MKQPNVFIMENTHTLPLELKIDYREKNSGILGEISRFQDSFHVEMIQLTTGDYLINNQILIERKRLPDFLESLKSGRLFQQAYRMINSGFRPMIILEGSKEEINNRQIKRDAVQGALLHLTVFLGIPIIRSASLAETVRLLQFTGNQLIEKSLPRFRRPVFNKPLPRITYHHKKMLAVLISIRGIGIEKASSLLNHFGTLKEIYNAGIDELQKSYGIGPKLAAEIYDLANVPYGKSKTKN